LIPRQYIEETQSVDGFPEVLAELKQKLTETQANPLLKFPQILFLGTGSCIPNKTRNTSGILVHTRYGTRQTHVVAQVDRCWLLITET
jgi:ribonuclease Z